MENFDKTKEINERISLILKHFNMSATSFAKEIDIASSVLVNVVGGRMSKPSIDLLQKICDAYPKISLEWIVLGRGEMFKDYSSTIVLKEPQAEYQASKKKDVDHYIRQIEFQNKHIDELTAVITKLSGK